jgi:predicted homoserine dehydrogenase-like protein
MTEGVMLLEKTAKIGIIGTGFIGSGLIRTINRLPDMEVACVLTRRNLQDFDHDANYTNSVQELIDKSEIVVECNGDPVYVTEVLDRVMDAGIPVVTMDAELHITSGSYLERKGLITEAEGDQPGALAALHRDMVSVGLKPLVYGNLKGFLNFTPTRDDMQFWSKKQGISIEQVVGATDGTKLQIEQAFVANGLGAVIAKQGLLGFESEDINQGAIKLASIAKEMNTPISDYLLCSPQAKQRFPAGVFITTECDPSDAATMQYLKLGEGPFYTLIRNYHLIYMEIPLTIRQVLRGQGGLLNNSSHPTASVCAIAKIELRPGTLIKRSDRNFQIRGEAITIKDAPKHVPIGLMSDVIIRRRVEPGQMIEFDDVEIATSKAYEGWQYTLSLVE